MTRRRSFFFAYVARATTAAADAGPAKTVARATLEAPAFHTLRGRVLRALVIECSLTGRSRAPEECVIVRAWRMWPASFALEGYPEHPDAGKVRAKLSALVGERLVRRTAPGVVAPTRDAYRWFESVGGGAGG